MIHPSKILLAVLTAFLLSVSGFSSAQAAQGTRSPLVEVKKKNYSDDEDEASDEDVAPKPRKKKGGGGGGGGGGGSSGGSSIWFAFWFPENIKSNLEEKKWLLAILGGLLFPIGGNLWGPMAFVGAEAESTWLMPSLLWFGIFWGAVVGISVVSTLLLWAGGIGFFFYFLIPFAYVAAYFGIMTTIANLNRSDVRIK